MPLRDPASGLFYVWRTDEDGRRYRDFSIRNQVDDRFEVRDDGKIIQVRRWPSCVVPDDSDDELTPAPADRRTAIRRNRVDESRGPPRKRIGPAPWQAEQGPNFVSSHEQTATGENTRNQRGVNPPDGSGVVNLRPRPQRLSAQADWADLELLWGLEVLHARGGCAAIYAVFNELGMRTLIRQEIDGTVRRHVRAEKGKTYARKGRPRRTD